MKIEFKELTFKNIGPYGNNTERIIFNNGLHIINASNGMGKSTIINALNYVLFGKPYTKIKLNSLINKYTKKNLLITIEFKINNDTYKVKRGIKPAIFEIYKNDELLPQPGETKYYQNTLEDILQIDEMFFKQIVALGANIPNLKNFMDLNQKEKENVLQILTNTAVFSELLKLVREEKLLIKKQKEEKEFELKILKNNLLQNKNTLYNIKKQNSVILNERDNIIIESENCIIENENKINEIDNWINKFIILKNKIKPKIEKYNEFENILLSKQNELNNIKTELHNKIFEKEQLINNKNIKQNELKHLKDLIETTENEIENLSNELAELIYKTKHILDNITIETCPKCGFYNENDLKNRIKNEEDRITELKKKITNKIDILECRLKDFNSRYNNILKEIESISISDLELLENELKNKISLIEFEINEIKKEKEQYQNYINTYKEKENEYKIKLKEKENYFAIIAEKKKRIDEIKNAKLIETEDLEKTVIDLENKISKLEKELNDIIIDFNDYNYIEDLISINNIKGKILERNLPILNNYINEYLEKFDVDFRFFITNDLKDEIQRRDENFEYHSLSNGEKQRIVLSILFSFLKLMEHSVSINVLFLDEFLDSSLDSEGNEIILNVLKDDFKNKSIYIITHKDDIKSQDYTTLIQIEKTKNDKFSTIKIF